MSVEKTKTITSVADARKKVNDVQVVGNGDLFQLLSKASSKKEGWMKSTKAMQVAGYGCLVQVTTQQGGNVAEAITFVPGVSITKDAKGNLMLGKL